MNRQIRRLALGLLACYVVLFAQLNLVQVNDKEELTSDPRNTRETVRDFNNPRGPIVTADGVTVAYSEPTPGGAFEYQRVYPTGELFANVTGYYTFVYGSTQIERVQNDVLAGRTTKQKLRGLSSIFSSDDTSGSVRLTLRADVQQLARDALGEREGSVVVMDPRTGAIIAMWSYPSYDPNTVVVPDSTQAEAALVALQNAVGKPLLANAYQERYMPGSTFKIITTGIALENGLINFDSFWENESEYVPPQTTDPIENYGGGVCGGDLREVFRRSCNTPFARIAVELGGQAMADGAKAWGIGEPIPIDLPRPAASFFGEASDFIDNIPLLAIRGFGQNEDQMVPVHMAMAAAAVANGGRMMAPYVVDATLDHNGGVLDRTEPTVWKTPLSEANAAILNELMQGVVTNGTASCCIALNSGRPVAAKTGTAQLNNSGEPERSHAWITTFAPADDPQYVVTVMIKGTTDEISASTGGRLAGPVANEILNYLLPT